MKRMNRRDFSLTAATTGLALGAYGTAPGCCARPRAGWW